MKRENFWLNWGDESQVLEARFITPSHDREKTGGKYEERRGSLRRKDRWFLSRTRPVDGYESELEELKANE